MSAEDVSDYVKRDEKSGIYRYYRRVPTEVAHLDKRTHVKESLKTRSHREALEKAEAIHTAAESLWKALLHGKDGDSSVNQYRAAVAAAQSLGFTYKPAAEAAAQVAVDELERRLVIAQEYVGKSPAMVNAALGTAPEVQPKLSDIWTLYEEHNRAGLRGLSRNQMRKHKLSRERAIRYAKDLLGDMELRSIKRADVLRFRSWWTDKIESEKLKAYSANRSFSDLMGMLSVIDNALQTSFKDPWEKARIKETNATKLDKRAAFSVEWVQEKMLAAGALDKMNEDARLIVYTMVETGMRLGEVCNLRPQDIRLDDEVPHVEVAERDDRRQKTDYSIRRIPLVGVALWAMKQRPQGFPRYQDKSDSASALINKVLTSANLRPTELHTVYSLRHTFQDRIENAETTERMQADLMGHEFGRPEYGDGPTMKRRQKFLESIKLVWPD
jgi:integrase